MAGRSASVLGSKGPIDLDRRRLTRGYAPLTRRLAVLLLEDPPRSETQAIAVARRTLGSLTPSPTWLRRALILGTFALFAMRFVLSLIRTGPVLVADEIGYLTNARVLAGGMHGMLEGAPF